jgi:hypothetical protein
LQSQIRNTTSQNFHSKQPKQQPKNNPYMLSGGQNSNEQSFTNSQKQIQYLKSSNQTRSSEAIECHQSTPQPPVGTKVVGQSAKGSKAGRSTSQQYIEKPVSNIHQIQSLLNKNN